LTSVKYLQPVFRQLQTEPTDHFGLTVETPSSKRKDKNRVTLLPHPDDILET
jgi:hypothetical protein